VPTLSTLPTLFEAIDACSVLESRVSTSNDVNDVLARPPCLPPLALAPLFRFGHSTLYSTHYPLAVTRKAKLPPADFRPNTFTAAIDNPAAWKVAESEESKPEVP